jgi:hypothetical protein
MSVACVECLNCRHLAVLADADMAGAGGSLKHAREGAIPGDDVQVREDAWPQATVGSPNLCCEFDKRQANHGQLFIAAFVRLSRCEVG